MTIRRTPIALGGGQLAVPGNRWDLASGTDNRMPMVSVVIPHFEQPRQLALVIGALELQTYPRHLFDIIVADDGSSTTPAGSDRVRVVRQHDAGFRAAAARNLGVANSSGEVICFLDADTIPEPSYLEVITRLPSIIPDAMVVGRRVHADLSTFTPDDIGRWFAGAVPGPAMSGEPSWLLDAYRSSGNLSKIDRRSYRWMISAVLCCSRSLFDEIGGFDETFTQYGGEDWELANRAVQSGAVLAHVPEAVAWHDGPDWAERPTGNRRREKNAEALHLAQTVTEPDARRHGLLYDVPDLIALVDTDTHSAASLLETVSSLVQSFDCGVWLRGNDAIALHDSWGTLDPRIKIGEVPPHILRRARFRLSVTGRVVFGPHSVQSMTKLMDDGTVGTVTATGYGVSLRSSRSIYRSARWSATPGHEELFGKRTISGDDIELRHNDAEPDLSW